MSTNTTAAIFKFANLQMASEATKLDQVTAGAIGLVDALVAGNGRASKFTQVLAEQFVSAGWQVKSHQANTPTGFSGTLFEFTGESDASRGLLHGEQVISFRSTEFIDDAVRDNQATNAMEISQFGWAFGQIADMKNWVDSLYSTHKIAAGNSSLSVTGYSLGGHLATAFNMLFPDKAAATYTFNGAGVGNTMRGVPLAATISRFDQMRKSSTDLGREFSDPAVRNLYENLKVSLVEGAPVTPIQLLAAKSLVTDDALRTGYRFADVKLLIEALERIDAAQKEWLRISDPPLSSGSTTPSLTKVDRDQIEATDLNYQLAVLIAGRNVASTNTVFSVLGRELGPKQFANFYDVFGDTTPSAVSNSQLHYGIAAPVYIENQPLWRGRAVRDAVANTLSYKDLKLLTDGFAINDFGDTHSLVLLVDSLAVENVLATLDPSVNGATLSAISNAASNAERRTGVGPNNQGEAEGDSLERVVDALRRVLEGPKAIPSDAKSQMQGGTWSDLAYRNTFFEGLKALTNESSFQALVGKVSVVATDRVGVSSVARTEFGAMVSLLALSPVALVATDSASQSLLDSVLQEAWGPDYRGWNSDRNLSDVQRQEGGETFTRRWVEHRADLLGWSSLRNRLNIPDGRVVRHGQLADRYEYEDIQSKLQFRIGPDANAAFKAVRFGGASSDALNGGTKADELFGGGGNDVLSGREDNDYLEGNEGADSLFGEKDNDTLLGGAGDDSLDGGLGSDLLEGGADKDMLDGGAGNDTLYGGEDVDVLNGGTGDDLLYGGAGNDGYFFDAGWGSDSIVDSDGKGSIEVSGFGRLTGVGAVKRAESEWTSADARVTYTLIAGTDANRMDISFDGVHDSIRINNWTNGALGLSFGGAVAAPVTDRTIIGDFRKLAINGNYWVRGGNYRSAGTVPSADDELNGSALGDHLLGLNGNDALSGLGDDDYLEGGDGDDFLIGGTGEDTLEGGAGRDVVFGSGYGALVLPLDANAPPPVARGIEITRGFSWVWWKNVGVDANGFETNQALGADYTTLVDSGNVISGGDGDDTLYGATGEDTIHGDAGDDRIVGLAGADTLFGDLGNDVIDGDGVVVGGYIESLDASEQGDDLLIGGAGDDTVSGDGGSDELYGGDGNDLLFGDAVNEKITPFASHGDDYLDGGAGNDELQGHGGDDELFGGTGNDTLFGDASLNKLAGRYHGADYLDGEEGDDYLEGGGGNDSLYGGSGNDYLWGDASSIGLSTNQYGADELDGEEGNDTLDGGGKADSLYGGDGNDVLLGDGDVVGLSGADQGADYLDGGNGDDYLRGDGKADTLVGGDGNDMLEGDGARVDAADQGDDYLDGGAGADSLVGSGGNDTLDGGDGDDQLDGGAGHDYLAGGAGKDSLFGGDGNDTLSGSGGADYLAGGAGDDTYIFESGDGSDAANRDVIKDTQGVNVIVMNGGAPVQFAAGASMRASNIAKSDSFPVLGHPDDSSKEADTPVSFVELTFADGDQLDIVNIAGGNNNSYQFGDDRVYSASELVGEFSDQVVEGDDTEGRHHALGGRGDDIIVADATFATLFGGRGNDTLRASGGRHTYLYGLGDGSDTIVDTSRKVDSDGNPQPNRIVFGAGITAGDLRLAGAPGALRVQVGPDSNDGIVIGGFDQGNPGATLPIDSLVFDDGTSLSFAELLSRGFDGGEGDDVLSGTHSADRMEGHAGDDSLSGGDGDETLTGGGGSDTLFGGAGSDRYVFAAGDGQDVIDNADANAASVDILTVVDIAPGDVVLTASATDLIVRFRDSTDRITVRRHFAGAALDGIEFGNGVVWGESEIAAHLNLGFTEGNDNVTGSNGDDILLALGGDDRVQGMGGNDRIDGGPGNDQLDGGEGSDTVLGGDGDDFLSGGTGDDFVDGGTGDDILRGGRPDNGVADIGSGNDTLLGGAGRDSLEGGDGDDRLDGGSGYDTLLGGAGNDTLVDGELMDGADGDDTYVLTSLSGGVLIEERNGGEDLLILPEGLTAANTRVDVGQYTGLQLQGPGGTVLLAEYFDRVDGTRKVEQIRFADGTSWSVADVLARLPANNLSDADDIVTGFGWGDNLSTLGGNDTVFTFDGNDAVDGGRGDDLLDGGAGDDTLRGSEGNDILFGEDGVDALFGGNGDDELYGSSGETSGVAPDLGNWLQGDAGNDKLVGSSGNDTLMGGSGNDLLRGASGDDTYLLGRSSGRDRIDDVDGRDRIVFDAGIGFDDVGLFRDGLDLLVAVGQTEAQTRIEGWFDGAAHRIENFQFGEGGPVWNAADIVARTVAGTANTMMGGPGDDIFVVDDAGDVVVEGVGQGVDTVHSSVSYAIPDNVENLTLTGYADLRATGNALANVITGNAGDNVLTTDDSRDTLIGGAGDDVYVVGTQPTIFEAVGGGTDLVIGNWSFTLPENVENFTALKLNAPVALRYGGNASDNVITGSASSTHWDTYDGGAGADTLVSLSGIGLFYVDNPGDRIVSADAKVYSSVDWTLAAGHSDLTLLGAAAISAMGNAGANVLDGSLNAAANVLKGGAGDDTYRIGAGDRVVELADQGRDTVVFAYRPSDGVLSIDALGSTSIERFTVDPGLTGSITIVGSSGSDEISLANDVYAYGRTYAGGVLRGNGGADTLVGGHGNDSIDGGDGDDLLTFADAFAGNDTFIGGAGNDVVRAGSGNDVVDAGAGNDVIDGGSGNNVFLFGAGDGQDTISGGAFESPAKLNVLRFKAGVSDSDVSVAQVDSDLLLRLGSSADQIVVRSFFLGDDPSNPSNPLQRVEFANGVSWGIGALRAMAHPGLPNSSPRLATPLPDVSRKEGEAFDFTVPATTFVDADVGDTLTLSATLSDGSGLPSWLGFEAVSGRFSAAASPPGTISVRVTATDFGGLAASDVFDLAIVSENNTIIGTEGRDTLYGASGNDTLYGLGGDDDLDGRAGTDLLYGGAGNDIFHVDRADDVVVENPGDGVDIVYATASYVLPLNVENLHLEGSASFGIGNAGDNVIQGTSASNRLDGGAGADTLSGGGGDDVFVVDNLGDVIVAGYGVVSTVEASISWTLQDGLQNLRLAGTASIDGAGNSLANALFGNAGNNRLDGAGGADTMSGGAGNDTFVVDSALDVVVEAADGGIDSVESSTTYALASNVENLRLTGTGAIAGTGNSMGNSIIGNGAANTLSGGAGDDSLDGAGGDDSLDGGVGNDTYSFSRGGGNDTVNSFDAGVNKVDTIQVGAGIVASDLAVTRVGDDLLLSLRGTGDTFRVRSQFLGNSASGNQIDRVRFADGTVWNAASLLSMTVTNHAPVLVAPLPDQSVNVGSAYSYTIPVGAFTDPDGDTLRYIAVGANGVLPAWLTFNAVTRTLSGNSAGATAGVVSIIVTAIDPGNLSIGDQFELTVKGFTPGKVFYGTPGNDYIATGSTNDTVYAGAGNDYVVGGIGDNLLYGEAGNDYLIGQAGVDTLVGGDGDDYYDVDNSADVVIEGYNQGVDSVTARSDYTLSEGIESLYLQSGSRGTGNSLDNSIYVDSASTVAHVLDGGYGADSMYGGLGDDTYFVDSIADVIGEPSSVNSPTGTVINVGIDSVYSTVSYTLPYGVENLTLTGLALSNGRGNGSDNVIVGNDSANTLIGDYGNDVLDGGAGSDALDGSYGNDVYRFGRGYGADTISSFEPVASKIDAIQLGAGITTGDVRLRQEGYDLVVSIAGTSDSIRVRSHFQGNGKGGYQIDQLRFVDGTSWDVLAIQSHLSGIATPTSLEAANAAASTSESTSRVDDVWAIGSPTPRSSLSTWKRILLDDDSRLAWPDTGPGSIALPPRADDVALIEARVQGLIDAMATFSASGADSFFTPLSHQFTAMPIIAAQQAA